MLRSLVLCLSASTVVANYAIAKADCTEDKDAAKCEAPIKDCTAVRVLEDVKTTGWKDGCKDLTWAGDKVKNTDACELQCKQNVNCSVWQWSGEGESGGAHCYSGVPDQGCRTRADFKANAGQRLQHGEVAVTGSALGMEVYNLMSFAMDAYDEAGEKVDAARCKQACYTDTTCGVWQYGMKNGAEGCWMEHHPTNVAGSIDNDAVNNYFAAAVTAGEFIHHYCPVAPPAPTVDMWVWLGPLLAVIAILLIGLVAYLLRKPPKVKKTRAIKLAPNEPEMVPLWVPQPTVLIPQVQPMMYQQVAQPQMVRLV